MPLIIEENTYFRTAEVCQLVRIGRSTLLRWLRDGTINSQPCRDRRGWRLFSEADIKEIDLPGKHWDILVKDDVLYVLSAIKSDKGKEIWIVRVTATRDLKAWQPLFQFESPTFARSFEQLNGAFYFGLGCEADDLRSETGRILRVP